MDQEEFRKLLRGVVEEAPPPTTINLKTLGNIVALFLFSVLTAGFVAFGIWVACEHAKATMIRVSHPESGYTCFQTSSPASLSCVKDDDVAKP